MFRVNKLQTAQTVVECPVHDGLMILVPLLTRLADGLANEGINGGLPSIRSPGLELHFGRTLFLV